MPSSTRRFVYRSVRFSVPVTFPVLTRRAERPRLRDDVGIVPYAGSGMFWVCRDDRDRGVSQAPGRIRPYETESVPPHVGVDALIDPGGRLPGGSFFHTGDILRFDRAGRASQIAGRCRHRPLRGRRGCSVFRAGCVSQIVIKTARCVKPHLAVSGSISLDYCQYIPIFRYNLPDSG